MEFPNASADNGFVFCSGQRYSWLLSLPVEVTAPNVKAFFFFSSFFLFNGSVDFLGDRHDFWVICHILQGHCLF